MTGSLVLDCWLAAAAGFVLDLIFGDPQWLPHPVRLIGLMISALEKRIRKVCRTSKALRRGAIWLATLVSLGTAAVCFGLLFAVSKLGDVWRFIGMVYFSYTTLGTSCLAREAKKVAQALGKSLNAGRKQLSNIVGRDTEHLSEQEVVKAAVETVAENTTDGSMSVLFYLFIGGPVLAYFFKAVSTLDSMVGYKNEQYCDIGWASARLDDVLNYMPARIAGVLMALSAYVCGLNGRGALRILGRDHANHASPNCGWTEAAAAGALGLQLGGMHAYFGKIVEKPTIGDDGRKVEIGDIARMNLLMYVTVCAAFVLFGVVACALYFLTTPI